jgi:hypothetical protein
MRKLVMLTVAAVALLTMMTVSEASGQGRGRGHGNRGWDKKCEKFVNCHDARDGRWDNRGPRRRLTLRNRRSSPYDYVRVRRGNHGRRVHGDRFYVRSRRY